MAGRKPSPKPDILTMLLGKMGLVEPEKKKKGKRRKRPRPATDPAAYAEAYAGEGSPFGDYGQASALGFEESDPYEAAAAAGYAPPSGTGEFADAVAEAVAAPEMPAYPAPRMPQAAATVSAAPPDGKLFSMDALDSSLDALFSGLESGTSQGFDPLPEPEPVAGPVIPEPITKPAPPPEPVAAIPDPIVTAPMPPAAPPARPEPVRPAPRPVARPATLMSAPPALADVLPLAVGVDLGGLLVAVDRVPGVAGSLLVGHDGLVIVSTLPPEVDPEYVGAQACTLFTGNGVQCRKMQRGELRRLLLETENGVMLMTAADMGILVVVSEDGQAMDPGAVMAAVAETLDAAER